MAQPTSRPETTAGDVPQARSAAETRQARAGMQDVSEHGVHEPTVRQEAAAEKAGPTGFLAGNPSAFGLISFIVGSVALGLALVGMVSAAALGASLPIILAATATGLFIATIWAAAAGQSAVATIFGVFAGFWLSYAVLLLGLTHNWFGIGIVDVANTQKLFLSAWLIVMALVTIATLRLPMAFTAVLLLVDAALVLLLLSVIQANSTLVIAAGACALAFALVGAYLFADSVTQATGGKALPLGRPILR
jgi:succinate-acetate transporter protein